MHLKRLQASRNYHIPKKVYTYTVAAKAGPHGKSECIPLGVLLRDILGFADTLSEAKRILNKSFVLVNGKIVKDYKFPVGLMDVLSFSKTDKHFRIIPESGKLVPKEIEKKNSSFKLGKIVVKNHVHGGKIQFCLHDGTTFLADAKKAAYKVGDTLKVTVPDNKIDVHLPMEPGSVAVIMGGKHVGGVGKIKEVQIINSPEPNMALVDVDGTVVRTLLDYVFVVGKDKPLIKI